jgi:hypothetical protein
VLIHIVLPGAQKIYFLDGFAGSGAGAGAGAAGAAGAGAAGAIAGCSAGFGASAFFSQPTRATVNTNTRANMIAIYFFMTIHLLSRI